MPIPTRNGYVPALPMTDTELDHLVQMANDIARNLDVYPDAAARTADHLRRFWAPALRERIVEHRRTGGAGLSDTALAAVASLDA